MTDPDKGALRERIARLICPLAWLTEAEREAKAEATTSTGDAFMWRHSPPNKAPSLLIADAILAIPAIALMGEIEIKAAFIEGYNWGIQDGLAQSEGFPAPDSETFEREYWGDSEARSLLVRLRNRGGA